MKIVATLSAAFALLAVPAALSAHVVWTLPNQADPSIVGLYHFEQAGAPSTGGALVNVFGASSPGELLIQSPVGTGFSFSSSTAGLPLGVKSLRADGVQRADSLGLFDSAHDTTIETWLKWDPAPAASGIEFGFRSSAKLRLIRDPLSPAADRFGLAGTHGSFVSANGFTDWTTIGTEEAPYDEWVHVAVVVHPTGLQYNSTADHDEYTAGSVARFYLNGHLFGAPTDVSGLLVHGESKLTISVLNGAVQLDEVTIWNRDLSNNGAVTSPFANGRGTGVTAADSQWQAYE